MNKKTYMAPSILCMALTTEHCVMQTLSLSGDEAYENAGAKKNTPGLDDFDDFDEDGDTDGYWK